MVRRPHRRVGLVQPVSLEEVRLEEDQLGDRDSGANPSFCRVNAGRDAFGSVAVLDCDLGRYQQRVWADMQGAQVDHPINFESSMLTQEFLLVLSHLKREWI